VFLIAGANLIYTSWDERRLRELLTAHEIDMKVFKHFILSSLFQRGLWLFVII
jgi:hypothetical protein